MIQKIVRNFISISSQVIKEEPYLVQPALDILSHKFRRIGLDHTVLDKRKVIVPAKRLRQPEDTIMKLHSLNECVGFIEEVQNMPEMDFVFDSKQIHQIQKLRNKDLRTIYIQNEDEEHRVILNDIRFSTQNWIAWAKFKRYIVGQPNLIYLPLIVKQGFSNSFLNKGGDYTKKMDGVWVYSYNDVYMSKFEIDPENLTPKRPFKMGDLEKCLPDGMELHQKHKKSLKQNILLINKDDEKKVEEALRSEMMQKKLDSGELKMDDEESMFKRKGTKGKLSTKQFKSKSLKKKLSEQAAEIKKQFAQADKK